ncbi:hypothetical protein BDW22DRAFT_492857 [Trametopsis cervina]|nr:hypothetical protein BDW22DRAFT_492857 [Trametopsis cervina]
MSDQPPVHPLIQSLGTADNPIHVISRPQQLTGWSGVQAGVDEFDKQEIDGHKDDMDSLLVFTGLFSAVLAAFVIIAYGLLQGGTTGSMLFVMSHTSVQAASYTIQGDYINSTTPAPTSPPPTEPTHNAIVVNILWNASLVVSLATASFAILVKQWLRQYTTFTTSFAMNRMRIRHFRRNGLEKWQVLGISSFLPFLLQIALGLFFVGLCYFTADVHPSVKNTTLPLVSAWAFLYISATICPVFSAHCPYKIPALDTLTTLTRNRLRRFYETVLQNIQAGNGRNAAGASTTANTTSRPAHIPVPSTVQRWAKRCLRRLNDKTRPYDETAAIATNTSDLDILLDADRLHGNDEVLDAAISHAIHQSKILPADAIPFTQQLIRNRIPTNVPFVNQPRFIDLLHLTPRAGAAVHNILDYMEWSDRDLGDGRIISFLDCIGRAASPERWAFFLRLSLSLAHPPITLPRWLDRCDSNSCHMLGRICQRSNSVQVYFEALDIPDWFTPNQVSSSSWDLVLNHESLGPTIAWLVRRLGLEIATPAPGSSNNHSHETTWADAASLIIKLMAITGPPQRSHDIQDLVLRSSEVLQRYWISCFRLQLPNRFFIPRENIDPEGQQWVILHILVLNFRLPRSVNDQGCHCSLCF